VRGLRTAGIEPLLLDLPGHGAHGDVPPDRVTLDHTLALIDEQTSHLDRYDLVGYSMGGRIALHVAVARPHRVRRLVLESASPGLAGEDARVARRAADSSLAERIEDEGVAAFVSYWTSLPLFDSQRALPENVKERLRRLRLENKPGGLAAALRGLGTGTLPDLWSHLNGLVCPVLLITGALDTKFVLIARDVAVLLPDVRLVEASGVGHSVHLEAPQVWLDAVGSFLGEGV